jgi:hypothetical protein
VYNTPSRSFLGRALLRRAAVLLCLVAATAAAADTILWKPLITATLNIDDKPVKTWAVYRPEKDKKLHRLLLQLGGRYLQFDTEAREVSEIAPAAFERHGKNLRMQRSAAPGKTLRTSDWVLQDIGSLWRIRARLSDEGRVMEIEVIKTVDLHPDF